MTNQEAAGELQYVIDLIKQDGKDWLDERDIPILEAAISALKAQDSQPTCNQLATDCISRQAAIDEIMKELKDRSLHDDEETSEDFADGYDEGIRNAATRVYLMPSAQPGTPTNCVSRQAVIDAITTWDKFGADERSRIVTWYEGLEPYVHLRDVVTAIVNLPSVQPEIIHCGECKHRDPEDHKCDCGHDILWQLPRDDGWYCADAERIIDIIIALPPAQPELSEIKRDLSDLISRQDAINIVAPYDEGREMRDALEDLPPAQPDLSGYSDRLWKAAYERGKAEAQADIIHCGECKYYHDSDGCFFSTATTGADGFCHWAERKEGKSE